MYVRSRPLSVAALAAGLLLTAPTAANAGIPDPAPIGPDRLFTMSVTFVS